MNLRHIGTVSLALLACVKGFTFTKASNERSIHKPRHSTRLFTAMMSMPFKVKASHILVKTEEKCDEILDGLQSAGWDFAKVASEESSCPSGQNGGDLGWFGKQQMVKEFEVACFENKVGDMMKVQTQFGWHVIKVMDQDFREPKPEPMSVRARHILVKDEGIADNILSEIQGGADFEALAKSQSSCPSKEVGGDLGWFGRGQMVAEFEEACYDAEKEGDLMKVKTQFGWHIIQLVGRKFPPQAMSVQDLAALLGDISARENTQLIDVREVDELAGGNNLTAQGFINLPLSKSSEWAPKIVRGELLDPTKKTVCMCKAGMRSMQMAQFLITEASFSDVANVDGGIDVYRQQIGL